MSRSGHPTPNARALVLGLHRVIASGELTEGLDVTPRWLRDVAALPYKFRTLEDSLKNRLEDSLVLTFDDGDPTVGTEALPVLAECGIRATAFVVVSADEPAPAFWRALLAGGWEIGSHSQTHAALDLIDAQQSRAEIRESKLRLEDMLGISIRGFAFPYGRFGRREIDFVLEAGYAYAVTTLPWTPPWWRNWGVEVVPRRMCDERTSLSKIQLTARRSSARIIQWLRDETEFRIKRALGTPASPLRILPF
nr:hypothetical protein Hi04_10k_c5981_00012 [uncultured bacterium]